LAVLALVAGAFAAACGDDDGDSSSSASSAAAPATSAEAPATSEAASSEAASSEAASSEAATEATDATSAEDSTAAESSAESTGESTDATTEPANPDVATYAGAAEGSGQGMKIGYISLGDSLPFVKIVSDSIKAEAEKAGAELVFCDSQLDGQKALDCARNMKTQGVQGILNFQLDAKAAPAVCAAGPDVPTIAIDIHQPPCEVSFMGADNTRAGELLGEAIGNAVMENGECTYDTFVLLNAPAAGDVVRMRADGTRAGFEKVCGAVPDDKYREVDGKGTTDGGRTAFADTLTALSGQHKIIVGSLNDDMALGAKAAAETAGRSDDIWIGSHGADPTSHDDIRNNPHWIGDVAYFPERYGSILVPAMIDAINGTTLPKNLLVTHEVITKENIDEYYPAGS
jgi:ribose transport system substrate-binding protein